MSVQSEVRVYRVIVDLLKELYWNTKSPNAGGQVYNLHEVNNNQELKKALSGKIPDFVVSLGDNEYWVIEAKARTEEMGTALCQAKDYAKKINTSNLGCRIISGVVGDIDNSFYIETQLFIDGKWKEVLINNRQSTGFFTLKQIKLLFSTKTYNLSNYEIDDNLFITKMRKMNDVLHEGAINKRDRAGVIACLLLAIANDATFQVNKKPSVLITDINTRAKEELKKYDRENFYQEISVKPPTSQDNHIKYKIALSKCLDLLRGLNIASTIGGGRDIIGQCYELFLKYANDAKEIGIVLTPRHITQFAVSVLNIEKKDIVFDPCCGTGGFLVSALDHVRAKTGDIEEFKKSNLFGIEQDPFVAMLAIVNMVFRGDGHSNISEGNCFNKECCYPYNMKPNKVLMNPPFALQNDFEHFFVDRALKDLEIGGLLFAILPTTTMTSSDNKRGERTWRENMLKRHTLIAVIKLPNELFKPVSKGTYAVVIKAHIPHENSFNVLWGIMDDGVVKSKTEKKIEGNISSLEKSLKNFIVSGSVDTIITKELDYSPINNFNDLSPEYHICTSTSMSVSLDIQSVVKSQEEACLILRHKRKKITQINEYKRYSLSEVFTEVSKGKSGRKKELSSGDIPLISTSEMNNGISFFVSKQDCKKLYKEAITISANGSSCYAAYHDYEFAVNPDVFIAQLKPKYKTVPLFICSLINSENWRFDYYRKFSSDKLYEFTLPIPINKQGSPDIKMMKTLSVL